MRQMKTVTITITTDAPNADGKLARIARELHDELGRKPRYTVHTHLDSVDDRGIKTIEPLRLYQFTDGDDRP